MRLKKLVTTIVAALLFATLTVPAPSADAADVASSRNAGVTPLGSVALCDFDGDGRADIFLHDDATGEWRISYDIGATYETTRTSTASFAQLMFGDVDGDSKCDVVFGPGGSTPVLKYSSAGADPWVTLLDPYPGPRGDLALCDFDGNGKADVFRRTSNDTSWRISYDATTPWEEARTSSLDFDQLMFADVTGDGDCDAVYSRSGTPQLRSSSGADSGWTDFVTYEDITSELALCDFDGNGTADVAQRRVDEGDGRIQISLNGSSTWIQGKRTTDSLNDMLFADVTGDGECDIVRVKSHGDLSISASGTESWTALGNEAVQVSGVTQAVEALESYGAQNFTYAVFGAGAGGEGLGKFESGTSYPAIISDVLLEQDHLAAPVIGDPDGALRVYPCADRVGVFADTDSIQASADDLAWWDANGCDRSPLDHFEYQYFELSAPLPPAVCLGQNVTVNMNLGQLPTGNRDVILGTPGKDDLTVYWGETVCTGMGNDIVRLNGANNDTVVDLGPGDDTVTGFTRGLAIVHGGDGNDIIEITEPSNRIEVHGGDGNDRIVGGSESDLLYGDPGNDDIIGGLGNDTLSGGDGDDDIRGVDGNDIISGDDGNDDLYGHDGNDTIYGGAGDDEIWAADGFDTVYGDSGTDTIRGGPGNDWLNGGSGNDTLKGDEGHDFLRGNAGDDRLVGGLGPDETNGGLGVDTCFDEGHESCELLGDTEDPGGDFSFTVGSTASYLVFNWTEATDNLGIASYRVYVDGSQIGGNLDPSDSSATIGGFNPNQSYEVWMAAVDDQGNDFVLDSVFKSTTDLVFGPYWGVNGSLYQKDSTDDSFTVEWTAATQGTTADHFEVTVEILNEASKVFEVPVGTEAGPVQFELTEDNWGREIAAGEVFLVTVVIVGEDYSRSSSKSVDARLDAPPAPTATPAPTPTPTPAPTPTATPTDTGAGTPPAAGGETTVQFVPPESIPGLVPGDVTPIDIFPYPVETAETAEQWECGQGHVTAQADSSTIVVSWTHVPAGASTYQVWLYPDPDVYGPGTGPVFTATSDTQAVVFWNVTSATEYVFEVKALDNQGNSLGTCGAKVTTAAPAVTPTPTPSPTPTPTLEDPCENVRTTSVTDGNTATILIYAGDCSTGTAQFSATARPTGLFCPDTAFQRFDFSLTFATDDNDTPDNDDDDEFTMTDIWITNRGDKTVGQMLVDGVLVTVRDYPLEPGEVDLMLEPKPGNEEVLLINQIRGQGRPLGIITDEVVNPQGDVPDDFCEARYITTVLPLS